MEKKLQDVGELKLKSSISVFKAESLYSSFLFCKKKTHPWGVFFVITKSLLRRLDE